jgi:hypothetical protein
MGSRRMLVAYSSDRNHPELAKEESAGRWRTIELTRLNPRPRKFDRGE